jgi:hypothetical protein
MADIRINALATTASSTASDDFVAIDGTTNGTRKLSAYSPTFGGNLTVSGTGTSSFAGLITRLHAQGTDGYLSVGTIGKSNQVLGYNDSGGTLYGVGTGKGYIGNLNAYDTVVTDGTYALATFSNTTGNFATKGNLTVSGGTVTSGTGTLTLNSSANTVVLQSAGTTALTLDSSQNATFEQKVYTKNWLKASGNGTYFGSTSSYHELRSATAGEWTTIFSHTSSSQPYGLYVSYTALAPNGTSNNFITFDDSSATRASIRSNGGLANYQSNNVDLSDARTKKDVTPLASMWSKIRGLEIVSYKYKDQTHDDANIGVIAQQVETVEPVWVDSDGFGAPAADSPLKTVYTKDITFASIKALQEAMARIEALEAKLA